MAPLSSKFAKQYGKKELLAPHLNAWFARAEFPDEIPILIHPNKPHDDKFHPSGDCLPCARVLYAKRKGLIPPWKPTAEQHKTFMLGHFYHALIYHIVQELGFSQPEDIEELVEMTLHGVPIKGHIDISSCVLPVHGDKMIDVKTQMARQFAQEPSGDLFEKYKAQVKVYLWLKDKSDGIILWAEKDNPHRFKETYVERDDDFVEEVFEKWAYVMECEAAGVVPDCTCDGVECRDILF